MVALDDNTVVATRLLASARYSGAKDSRSAFNSGIFRRYTDAMSTGQAASAG
jgi:hypothetical protein